MMPDQQQTAETSCAEAMHLLSKAKHLLKNGEYEQQKEVPELDRVFLPNRPFLYLPLPPYSL